MKRNTQIGIAALIVIVLVAGAGYYYFAQPAPMPEAPKPETPKPKPMEKVVVQLNWVVDSNQAGYFVAKYKGWYAERGLDVELKPGQGAAFAARMVSSGAAQFGVGPGNIIIASRIEGAPLKMAAQVFQNHPASYFTLTKTGIESPKDFQGKTIAVQSGSVADYTWFKVIVKRMGVTEWKEIPISFDMITPLLQDKAVASMGWSTNRHNFYEKGVAVKDLKVMRIVDYGLNPVSTGIFTSDDVIKNKPDVVKKFVEASLLGWKYAFEHPGETVDIIMKVNPELKRPTETALLEDYLTQQIWSPVTKQNGVGYGVLKNWQETHDLLFEYGVIKKKLDNIQDVFTNEFLPKAPVIPTGPYAK